MSLIAWTYNTLVDAGDIASVVAVFILLPLSLFKSTRGGAEDGSRLWRSYFSLTFGPMTSPPCGRYGD